MTPGRVRVRINHRKRDRVNDLVDHWHLFLLPSDYTFDSVSSCIEKQFKVGGAVSKVYLKFGASEKKCNDTLNEIKGETDSCDFCAYSISLPGAIGPGLL